MTSESPDALESLVGHVADEFTRRHQRGETPRIEEYTDRYPDLADLLREILPAIKALGTPASRTETPRAHETPGRGPFPRSLAHIIENEFDYEILGEIGRGGMGVVYKARHRTLRRIVALKVLRGNTEGDLARFRREAQAVARLQHSNIVQIFEVREAGGQPFLALEYVAGGSLADRIKAEPQPPRPSAGLVLILARAIAVAHDCGLIHRDLKPSNVLLSVCPNEDQSDEQHGAVTAKLALDRLVPKISDFGLVKRLDEDTRQTQSGAIVGTPSYMAPEQAASSEPVTPAADVYALGAILYELLTGRPPFQAPSALETLELIRHTEPTPPAQLQPGCPRDLETICLKCLRKDPIRRYGSAALLADDLQRFLDGVAIHARPVGGIDRLGKWLRRRPTVAASIGFGSVALLALVALGVRLAYSWQLEDANRQLGEAVSEKEVALLVAEDARHTAEHNRREADAARGKLDAVLEQERALHYVHSINLAHREWQANRVDEARRILEACPRDLRHWEWHYLYRQSQAESLIIRGHIGAITALATSPDGRFIAGASFARDTIPPSADLKVWDATTGKLAMALDARYLVSSLAFSPDGTRLASVGNDITIRIWDLTTGKELHKIKTGSTLFPRVAFSPDGTRLATLAKSEIRLFDADSGIELFTLSGHTEDVRAMAFSPDGQRLVSGGSDRLVKLWDLATGKEVFSKNGHTGAINSVAFSPRQDQIVTCGAASGGTVRGEVRVWSAVDGTPAPNAMTFPFAVGTAVFTANPGQVACAGDGRIHFLDASAGGSTFVLQAASTKLAMAPDGKHVVTDSSDRTLRVWPVRNPEFVEIPLSLPVHSALALSNNGAHLAWSDFDQFAQRWGNRWGIRVAPLSPAGKGSLSIRPTRLIVALAFTPDNRRIACADQNGVDLIDLESSQISRVVAEFGVWAMSISPDSRYLATATRHPAVNPQPGIVRELEVEETKGRSVGPTRLPVPAIKIWSIADGSLIRMLPGEMSVCYSPDGGRLAGARDRSVVVWDVSTGNELRTLAGSAEPVLKVQFAAGGRQIVGFTRRQATIWDVDSGRIIANVEGLDGPAFLSPDGRRIVGIHTGGIKWWDVHLNREILFLTMPEAVPRQLALSADGRCLAVVGGNRLMLWEAALP